MVAPYRVCVTNEARRNSKVATRSRHNKEEKPLRLRNVVTSYRVVEIVEDVPVCQHEVFTNKEARPDNLKPPRYLEIHNVVIEGFGQIADCTNPVSEPVKHRCVNHSLCPPFDSRKPFSIAACFHI